MKYKYRKQAFLKFITFALEMNRIPFPILPPLLCCSLPILHRPNLLSTLSILPYPILNYLTLHSFPYPTPSSLPYSNLHVLTKPSCTFSFSILSEPILPYPALNPSCTSYTIPTHTPYLPNHTFLLNLLYLHSIYQTLSNPNLPCPAYTPLPNPTLLCYVPVMGYSLGLRGGFGYWVLNFSTTESLAIDLVKDGNQPGRSNKYPQNIHIGKNCQRT